MVNKQIYITSVVKAVNKAKKTGKLNLTNIQMYKLVSDYIDYAKNIESLKEQYIDLKIVLAQLMYKYPNDICNYKVVIGGTATTNNIPSLPPTVDNNTIDINTLQSYKFKISDFTKNFQDPNGDSYLDVRIDPNLITGELYYGGNTLNSSTLVTSVIQIPLVGDLKLYYKRTNSGIFTDYFNFKVSENTLEKLYTSSKLLTITGANTQENLPPVIGDITLYPDNRAITIISLSMLTTLLTPPYNDPEGDLIDAIMITEISDANKGKYYLDGLVIYAGIIISKQDLIDQKFIHVGADQDAVSSDVFSFKARDEGSKIWVE